MRSKLTDETIDLAARRSLKGLLDLCDESESNEYFNMEAVLREMPQANDPQYGRIQATDVRQFLEEYASQGIIDKATIVSQYGPMYSGAATGYRIDRTKRSQLEQTIGDIG